MNFTIKKIEAMIYKIKGHNVMLDSDLAKLYGVETKVLNQAVKRNLKRFPEDFMFECDLSSLDSLRSQFVTANSTTKWNSKRRSAQKLFGDESFIKEEVGNLKKNTNQLFKIVFERLDNLDEQITPQLPTNRKKIGIKQDPKN